MKASPGRKKRHYGEEPCDTSRIHSGPLGLHTSGRVGPSHEERGERWRREGCQRRVDAIFGDILLRKSSE